MALKYVLKSTLIHVFFDYISPLNLCVVCGMWCVHVRACVCVRSFIRSFLGCLDDMCSQRHLECPECERWRGKTRAFVATPLMAGHAIVIGWSLEVRVQSEFLSLLWRKFVGQLPPELSFPPLALRGSSSLDESHEVQTKPFFQEFFNWTEQKALLLKSIDLSQLYIFDHYVLYKHYRESKSQQV